MKYLYLIVIIFLLSSCTYYNEETEDYNYLPDNSLRFIRTEEDTSILIHKDNIYYGENRQHMLCEYIKHKECDISEGDICEVRRTGKDEYAQCSAFDCCQRRCGVRG